MARAPRAAALLALLACAGVHAADPNRPHDHTGKLPPYSGSGKVPKVTGGMAAKLDTGAAVIERVRDGKEGRGLVIQDVAAPPDVCWSKINDFPNYPKMVPQVTKVEVYGHNKAFNGTEHTFAKFTIGVLGIRIGYYMDLTHDPRRSSTTWTLDYSRNSDLDDSVGWWHVQPHPSKAKWSRVFYSTQIKVKGWVPKPIMDFLTNKALTESTAWVKRESEEAYTKQQSSAPPPRWARGLSSLSERVRSAAETAKEQAPKVSVFDRFRQVLGGGGGGPRRAADDHATAAGPRGVDPEEERVSGAAAVGYVVVGYAVGLASGAALLWRRRD